jgi:hypothetical protein
MKQSPKKRISSFLSAGMLVLVSGLCLSGCSDSLFHGTPPQVQATLIKVANSYLTHVAAGDEATVAELVYWPDLLGSGTARITKAEFDRQFHACLKHWSGKRTAAEHPLVGLRVLEASADGNFAKVRLSKDPKYASATPSDLPEITVEFIWEGTGWIVRKDSLFGPNKYCSRFVNAPPSLNN